MSKDDDNFDDYLGDDPDGDRRREQERFNRMDKLQDLVLLILVAIVGIVLYFDLFIWRL